ncbi:hypothetical protein B5180_23670 [Streptomyces sp. BF-3]|nr:hypothetical protein B5180_23670 [Streptomyces sp. BF-3]
MNRSTPEARVSRLGTQASGVYALPSPRAARSHPVEQTWWEYETEGRPDADQFGLTVTDQGQQV